MVAQAETRRGPAAEPELAVRVPTPGHPGAAESNRPPAGSRAESEHDPNRHQGPAGHCNRGRYCRPRAAGGSESETYYSAEPKSSPGLRVWSRVTRTFGLGGLSKYCPNHYRDKRNSARRHLGPGLETARPRHQWL